MKLSTEVIQHIKNAVTTAKLLNMEGICIDDGLIRATREDKRVLIIHPNDIDLPFDSIGIARIPQFLSRIGIISESTDASIECSTEDDIVRTLVMKCPGTKVDFKCTNPSQIVAFRKLNDPIRHTITISLETLAMMRKSETAMKAEFVTIVSDDDGVHFEMCDINSDIFKHNMDTKVDCVDCVDTKFAFRYDTKLLTTLLRTADTTVNIAEQGTLIITINGITIYIIPKA